MSRHLLHRQDFGRLFDEHAQPLFGFLVYRTGDRALAEDVLADTFERAMRARSRFDPRRGSEKNWLYAIALNLLRDQQRRAGAESRALEREVGSLSVRNGGWLGSDDPSLQSVADRDAISRALGCLSSEEREAIALRYGADMTAPEIAALTGQPLTTIEGRIYRSLRKLREEMAPPPELAVRQ